MLGTLLYLVHKAQIRLIFDLETYLKKSFMHKEHAIRNSSKDYKLGNTHSLTFNT